MALYFSPKALTLWTTLVGAVAAKPLMSVLYSWVMTPPWRWLVWLSITIGKHSIYSFLDGIHCVLDDRVGSIFGVADDHLLLLGGSVGQGHEESDEEEMDGELHVG